MSNRIIFAVSATPRFEAVLSGTFPSPLGDVGKHQAERLRKIIARKVRSPRVVCASPTHVLETARRISRDVVPLHELYWDSVWRPRRAALAVFSHWTKLRDELVVCMPFCFTEALMRALFPRARLAGLRTSPGDALEVTFPDCNSPFVCVTAL